VLALFESPESWLLVGLLAIPLFGSSKLPGPARSLGLSKSEFEKGLREGSSDKPEERAATEEKPEDDTS
jgi:Sec-independent protein translocase protein TatA